MKVLAVGMPKTGTKSICSALGILGYKVYDFEHNFYYLRHEWMKVFTKGGTKEDFYRMFKDVDASTDIPANVFWEEILEAFPDMKMIFTKRKSEDEWWQSFKRQIRKADESYILKLLVVVSPTARALWRYTNELGRVLMSTPPQRFCEGFKNMSPTVAKKRYRDHNTSVLQRAPKEQLLEFDLSDGWEPLCKFLDKEVPDVPFPHKNKRGELVQEYLRQNPVFLRMKFEMKMILAIFIAILGIIFVFFIT